MSGKGIVLFIMIAASVVGAEFYVSPTGDNGNPGSEAQPWLTVQKAVTNATAGDTVFLRGGVHTNTDTIIDATSSNSGETNNPITLRAYPNETPVIAGAHLVHAADLVGVSHWVLDGLTFSNNYVHWWMQNCTNVVWINCYFGASPTNHAYAGCLVYGSSQFNVWSNCTWYAWGTIDELGEDVGSPFKLGADANPDPPCYYNLVVSNKFIFGMHDNAEAESGYNVWRGNLFVNSPWFPTNSAAHILNGYNPAWDEENMYGAYGNRWLKPNDGNLGGSGQHDGRNVYEYNTFLYAGPPVDDYGGGGFNLGNNLSIVRFNTICFSLHAGFAFDGSGLTSKSNCVYGNTIYRNGLSWVHGGLGMQDASGGIRSANSGLKGTNYLVNNIIWGNFPTNTTYYADTWQIIRTNWNGDFPTCTDPLFVSTNGSGYTYNSNNLPNLRLRSGSPCIDAGTWLAFASADGSGTTLTVDNSLYFSDGNRIVTGDTIQLQGQTDTSIVMSNDFANNTLYLSSALSWTNGQGVSLTYLGSAPDQGAFEAFAAKSKFAGKLKLSGKGQF